jgi:hypothetical protein
MEIYNGSDKLSELEMLKADEKQLANDFQLVDFFRKNSNYLLFIEEMKKIVERRFHDVVRSSWAKSEFVDLAKAFLERNEPLFEHVSNVFAAKNNSRDISSQEWEQICTVCAKIVVCMGWNYESSE